MNKEDVFAKKIIRYLNESHLDNKILSKLESSRNMALRKKHKKINWDIFKTIKKNAFNFTYIAAIGVMVVLFNIRLGVVNNEVVVDVVSEYTKVADNIDLTNAFLEDVEEDKNWRKVNDI